MPKKILVSDPYEEERKAIKEMLESGRYDVSIAGCLRECIPFLLREDFDLMLIREEYVLQYPSPEDMADDKTRRAVLLTTLTGQQTVVKIPESMRDQQVQRVFDGDVSLRDRVKEILEHTPRLFLAPTNHPVFGDTTGYYRLNRFNYLPTRHGELPDRDTLLREIGRYIKK